MNTPDWSLPFTLHEEVEAVGNGLDFVVNNYGAVLLALTGTFVGTVTWEASFDGATWFGVLATNKTTAAAALTATAPGLFLIPMQGIGHIRARVSAWTSGKLTVKGIAVPYYAA